MNNPELYMMCGLSGSGKTTFAKQFASLKGLRYLSPDDFYALYNGDDRNHIHEFDVWMALFRALHMAEQDGVSAVLDTNSPTFVDRVQILNWFPDFTPHLICVTAPTDLCLLNNKLRRRVVPEDIMEQMISHFKMPDVTEWEQEKRWRSITVLNNDSNKRYTLAHCFHRGENQQVPNSMIEEINLIVRANKIRNAN